MLLVGSPVFLAGVRTVSWTPSAGADGYRVHYGPEDGNYTTTIDVGSADANPGTQAIEFVTDELDDCTTWHFSVTAYNIAGESGYSDDAPWLTPMGIDHATANYPDQPIRQGVEFAMTLFGAGFDVDAEVVVDHPDWTCADYADEADCDDFLAELRSTVQVEIDGSVDCNSIPAWVTIGPSTSGALAALTGDASNGYTVTVTNPGGSSTVKLLTEKLPLSGGEPEFVVDASRFDVVQNTERTTGRLDGADVVGIARLFGTCLWPGTAAQPCCNESQDLGECELWHSDYSPDLDLDGDGWISGQDLAHFVEQAPSEPALFGTCWDGASWKASACD
jgi:hypothetical protein